MTDSKWGPPLPDTGRTKIIYCEKGITFEKKIFLLVLTFDNTKQCHNEMGRFFTVLWTSQNIWPLIFKKNCSKLPNEDMPSNNKKWSTALPPPGPIFTVLVLKTNRCFFSTLWLNMFLYLHKYSSKGRIFVIWINNWRHDSEIWFSRWSGLSYF